MLFSCDLQVSADNSPNYVTVVLQTTLLQVRTYRECVIHIFLNQTIIVWLAKIIITVSTIARVIRILRTWIL